MEEHEQHLDIILRFHKDEKCPAKIKAIKKWEKITMDLVTKLPRTSKGHDTYHGFVGYPFDYRVTLGFGSIAGDLDHVSLVIRLPIERGSNSGTRIEIGDDVDISTLTIPQYLALIQDDIKPGVVKPEIGNDVEFEINSNFMRELRGKLFAGTDDDDSYEHVRRILEIVDLFHFPGVTHDAVMLRVFPITLKGQALRWKKRLPAGVISTWDLLEKEFIWQYCSPFKTAKI
ncbi:hypothetical protein Tco_1525012 [Tanacetum coccineum]